jgi:hypothetical protein
MFVTNLLNEEQHLPVDTRWQFSVEQVCYEVLQSSAKKVIAVESTKAKPSGVFGPSIYQMLSPQIHWEYQS